MTFQRRASVPGLRAQRLIVLSVSLLSLPAQTGLLYGLQDNYSWLLVEKASGKTAIVDPAEAQPVIAALQARSVVHLHRH